jgi:hypothetical protein
VSSIKALPISRSDIISIKGAIYGEWGGQQSIVPQWKRGMSNTVTSSNSGEYDGGDRVIGFGAYHVDGDLLITAGWGDGCAIRRLNDDGSMTKLYYDSQALFRDTTSTYNHINSLAGHSGSSQICLTTHNVNGYSMLDYSDLKVGGTTVVNTRPPTRYVFSNGVNIDRSGNYYESGTVTAGDWLYILDYDASHYKKYPRRNWLDGTEELINGTLDEYKYTGSATIDRNGYRGYVVYDEINDRVFYMTYYNANFMMILNASTANPKCVWCDMADVGLGDDSYESGLFIDDPVNEPNKIKVGCNSKFAHIDITPCFTGSKATLIAQIHVESTDHGFAGSVLLRGGTNKQGTSGEWIDKIPEYPEFHPTSSDRGRNQLDGWFDWSNNRIVGLYRLDSTTEDQTGGRGRSYRSDYSNPIFRMTTSNGTKYWVKTGYGADGHSFKVWSEEIGAGLIGNWSCEFGTYKLNNSGNIDFCHLEQQDHFTPSSCSLAVYLSNNNGSSWESYNINDVHNFSSTGSELRVRYVATGHQDKAPYKMSFTKDSVTFGTLYTGLLDNNIPTKVVRRKIRGRKG